MSLETDHKPTATAVEEPPTSRSTGTGPDEWRLGDYDRVVVETEGAPW